MVKAGNTDNYEFCMTNNSILKQVKIEELESQMNRKRLKNLRKFENRKLNKEKNERLDKNEQNQGHINEEAEYEQHLNQMNESLISTRNRTTLVSRNYRIPVMTRPRRNFIIQLINNLNLSYVFIKICFLINNRNILTYSLLLCPLL